MIGCLNLQAHFLSFLDGCRGVSAIVVPEDFEGCSDDLILFWFKKEITVILEFEVV